MLNAIALGACCLAQCADSTPQPTPSHQLRDLADSMHSHARRMKDASSSENSERMAAKGKQLEQRLSALIAKLSPRVAADGPAVKRSRLAFETSAPAPAAPGSPKAEEPPLGVAASTDDTPVRVSTRNDAWHRLPAAQREQMLQAWRLDIAAHWRKRLEAYYLSLSAEPATHADDRK